MNLNCPHCRNAFEIVPDSRSDEVTCPSCRSKIHIDLLFDARSDQPTLGTTVSQSDVPPDSGDMIAHFKIEKLLGKGAFGSVYSAFDSRLERYVALKVPRLHLMHPSQLEYFIREAQAAAQLRDPNIVSVHEIGRDGSRAYIVSDLIDGTTLGEWAKEQKPDFKASARLVETISRAIHRAHEKGIVHRDLKPRNILMDGTGSPHITDFGLAKRENPESITITAKGQVIGTPAYMSPEQARGESHNADRRSDIYSLGVILYELLTGRRPFKGDSDLLINEILTAEITPPRSIVKSIPPDLEAICLKAVARDPAKRFNTAEELADELERFVLGRSTLTRPAGVLAKAWCFLRDNRVAAAIGTLCVALLASVIAAASNWPATPFTLATQFHINPADCEVTIQRFDLEQASGFVKKSVVEKWSSPKQSGFYEFDLTPGLYQIELRDSNQKLVQSILRSVPTTTHDTRLRQLDGRPVLRSVWWERVNERRIEWPKLELQKIPVSIPVAAISGGKFVEGNSFMLTNTNEPILKPKEVTIAPFRIGIREVTASDFQALMGYLPPEFSQRMPPDIDLTKVPITFVTYDEAVEFCERAGGRLPTVNDYTYVATNGGTTTFPWGDDATLVQTWDFQGASFDTTKTLPAVQFLYSGALEWTQDIYIPPLLRKSERGTPASYSAEMLLQFRSARVVVGGDAQQLDGTTTATTMLTAKDGTVAGPRMWGMQPISTRSPALGFRIVFDQ